MDPLRRLTIAALLCASCFGTGPTEPEPQHVECVPSAPDTLITNSRSLTLVKGSAEVVWIEWSVDDRCSFESLPLTDLTAGTRDSSVAISSVEGDREVHVVPQNPGETWLVLDSPEFLDSIPVAVPDTFVMGRVAGLSANRASTCAVEEAGRVMCWGSNSWELLGHVTDPAIGTCYGIPCSPMPKPRDGWQAETLALGLGMACFLDPTGVGCWRWGALESLPDPGLTSLTVGEAHACGLTEAGEAYCWGANDFGQLGDDRRGVDSHLARAVTGSRSWTSLHARRTSTCGVESSGRLYCWGLLPEEISGVGSCEVSPGGKNSEPQTAPCADEPWRVPMGQGLGADTLLSQVAEECVLTQAGRVLCAEPGTVRFEAITASGSFASIEAGLTHYCGLTAEGAARCWGANHSGQLGTGETEVSPVPLTVEGGHTFTDLALGGEHSCGLDPDGVVWCWGDNHAGQAGGSILESPRAPRRVPAQGG